MHKVMQYEIDATLLSHSSRPTFLPILRIFHAKLGRMKLTILGCGASAGVPVIGCECDVCSSTDVRNKRQRASVLLETNTGKQILVDATPDLRQQALRHGLSTIDALIITHAHADHCHGLDDVRPFNYHRQSAIDLYADAHTMQELQHRFNYIFRPHKPGIGWYKPEFVCHTLDEQRLDHEIAGETIQIIPQTHGRITTLGIRAGDIAYSTDVNHLSDEAFDALRGVKVWVVDCLRYTPAPTHAHLELTLEWIERVKPQRAILTHMSHELDYHRLQAETPDHVDVAYDGMVIEVP